MVEETCGNGAAVNPESREEIKNRIHQLMVELDRRPKWARTPSEEGQMLYETAQRWLVAAGLWPEAGQVVTRDYLLQVIVEILMELGDLELQAVQWTAMALVVGRK